MKKTRFIAHAAIIAAVYATLTVAVYPLSYGTVQVRFAEALTFLAALTPAAVPGLFVGCLIANIYTGSLIDIIFGSLTTLAAALASYKLRKNPWLVPLPPILFNALIVGYYLTLQYGGKTIFNMLSVGAGQLAACYAVPLYFIINYKKTTERLAPYVQYHS
ncbi:MAG: QueT transporter family protein [Clostridiales bacterium]|nr:QueT transporter family protein [Clostridiales bacterium]